MEIGDLLNFASDIQKGTPRSPKEAILNAPNFLIGPAVQEIDAGWEYGTLAWMKWNCPKEWKKMLGLEKRINNSALRGDTEGLKHALREYRVLMLSMAEEFLTTNGKRENVFVERGNHNH
jgi:hypothetical protein